MSVFTSGRRGKLPVVLQAEQGECGLVCLAMVLSYYGHLVDIHTLRSRCPVSGHGMTLKAMMALATRLALVARPLRLEMGDLGKLALPAILHWDLEHFVVLAHLEGESLVIHDPASGRREIGQHEAGRHFTGVALELVPAEEFQPQDERQKLSLAELWKGSAMLGNFLQLLVLSLLLQAFAIALPFYTQLLVDDVLVNHDVDLLTLLALGFMLVILFRQLTELVRAYVVMWLGNRMSFRFATRLCRHLLHLPLEWFSRRHIGDIVSRFNSLNNVRDFLCSGVVEVSIDGLMVIATLILMWIYSGTLTLIALAGVVCYAVVRMATFRRLQASNEEWINDRAQENTLFMENVNAIQGIKLAGREASRLGAWQNRYIAAINSGIRVQKLGIGLQFANGLLLGGENIILLFAGARAVMAGSLSIGMLLAFVSFKDHFYRSVFSLLDTVFEFKVLDVHLARLADIAFSEPESHGDSPVRLASPGCAARLQLSDLGFRHDPDSPWLFRQVNLDMTGSEVVAIIGPTGCGKSTLLKIVASLLEAQEGKLLLDGESIGRRNLESYRCRISGVMQDDSLLSGSILENITFFDSSPDLERAQEAARLASVDGEIDRLPMGFHTRVGNMGSALSGGQVQRLLLARAIYQHPALLILDEATSHLDIATETRVNRSLRQLGIACLVVAHRPETVLQADRILFLTPAGLLPVSHEKFRLQMSKQDEDDVITI